MSFAFSILPQQAVITAMLIFARIGSCLMVMPGFANARVPMKIRLFLALALTLALFPLLEQYLHEASQISRLDRLVVTMVAEMLIGASLGLVAQALFWGLQFIGNVIAMLMGFSGQPGLGLLESRPEAPIANIIALMALAVFFALDMHVQIFGALLASYQILSPAPNIQPQAALIDLVDSLQLAFSMLLRMVAPFLLYAILVNFAAGLINKLTPNIPVYFISLPFVLAGGLALLCLLLPELGQFLLSEMSNWGTAP